MNLKKIEISISKKGILDTAELHDAEIFAIFYDHPKKPRNLNIQMRAESGTVYAIKFLNVKCARVDGFNHQNIIYEVEIYKKKTAIDRLDIFKRDADIFNDEMLQNINEEILSGRSICAYFAPSYGCEILVVCNDFELYQTTDLVV